MIVLDPGHSGKDISSVDPATGLHDHDYPNDPEIYEAWNVSQQEGKRLQKAGYDVIYTKDSALDSVSLRDRANIAQDANADLSVSIRRFNSMQGQDRTQCRGFTTKLVVLVWMIQRNSPLTSTDSPTQSWSRCR
ncbi:hypothetical protein BH10CYA1_BH10CYA1_46110 [soil metagenome]